MNEHSSRAHSIFKLMVESQLREPDNASAGIMRHSTLCMVDLAGSENAKMTNSKGERARYYIYQQLSDQVYRFVRTLFVVTI